MPATTWGANDRDSPDQAKDGRQGLSHRAEQGRGWRHH